MRETKRHVASECGCQSSICRAFSVVVLPLAIGMAGCSSESADESSASTEEEIRNPTMVDSDTHGLVAIENNYGSCSGTLLSSRWILTARHCIYRESSGLASAQNSHVRFGTSITKHFIVDYYVKNDTADAGLVHLASDSPVAPPPVYQITPLYPGFDSTLINRTLKCFGYGQTTDGELYYGNPLQTANLLVTYTGKLSLVPPDVPNTPFVQLTQSATNQIQLQGDSGGPCFLDDENGTWLASIYSWNAETGATTSATVGAQRFRDWVWQTMGSTTPATPAGFSFCGMEGQDCSETNRGTRLVAFGAEGKFTYKWLTTTFPCTREAFDYVDPAPGVWKYCLVSRRKALYCATEGGKCSGFLDDQLISYGTKGFYNWQVFPGTPGGTGSASCNNATFGDPFVGVRKGCYKSNPGTLIAAEGSTYTWGEGVALIGFGANGQFNFKEFIGSVRCLNEEFGGDPLPTVPKSCYMVKCPAGLAGCTDSIRN